MLSQRSINQLKLVYFVVISFNDSFLTELIPWWIYHQNLIFRTLPGITYRILLTNTNVYLPLRHGFDNFSYWKIVRGKVFIPLQYRFWDFLFWKCHRHVPSHLHQCSLQRTYTHTCAQSKNDEKKIIGLLCINFVAFWTNWRKFNGKVLLFPLRHSYIVGKLMTSSNSKKELSNFICSWNFISKMWWLGHTTV